LIEFISRIGTELQTLHGDNHALREQIRALQGQNQALKGQIQALQLQNQQLLNAVINNRQPNSSVCYNLGSIQIATKIVSLKLA